MTGLLSHLLALHGVVAYALVGTVAFAEAALFVGFVLLGETAVLLGGGPGQSARGGPARDGGRGRPGDDRRGFGGLRGGRTVRRAGARSAAAASPAGADRPGPPVSARQRRPGGVRGPVHRVPARRHARPRRDLALALPPLPAVQRYRRAAVGDRVHPARLPRRRVLHEGGEDRRPGLPRAARPHRAGRVRGLAASPPEERGEAERDRGAGPPP